MVPRGSGQADAAAEAMACSTPPRATEGKPAKPRQLPATPQADAAAEPAAYGGPLRTAEVQPEQPQPPQPPQPAEHQSPSQTPPQTPPEEFLRSAALFKVLAPYAALLVKGYKPGGGEVRGYAWQNRPGLCGPVLHALLCPYWENAASAKATAELLRQHGYFDAASRVPTDNTLLLNKRIGNCFDIAVTFGQAVQLPREYQPCARTAAHTLTTPFVPLPQPHVLTAPSLPLPQSMRRPPEQQAAAKRASFYGQFSRYASSAARSPSRQTSGKTTSRVARSPRSSLLPSSARPPTASVRPFDHRWSCARRSRLSRDCAKPFRAMGGAVRRLQRSRRGWRRPSQGWKSSWAVWTLCLRRRRLRL